MTGLEVLGAVAAAVQLAETGLKIARLISDIRAQVHDAPASLARRLAQIQQLTEIAKLIETSPALQTKLIETLVQSSLRDANELETLLQRMLPKTGHGKLARYWKAVGDMNKEKQLSTLCDRLEEGKSAITLCIVSIGSNQSANIGSDVREIVGQVPTIGEISGGVKILVNELQTVKSANLSLRSDLATLLNKVTLLSKHSAKQPSRHPDDESDSSSKATEASLRNEIALLNLAVERLTIATQQDSQRQQDSTDETGCAMPSLNDATKCLNSLPAVDQQRNLRLSSPDEALRCSWFLNGQVFKQWKMGHPADLLYITARAGCGKTTLATQIVRALLIGQQGLATPQSVLKDAEAKQESPITLFFFFSRSNQLRQSTNITMTATLISQMVRQRPLLLPLLMQEYEMNEARGGISWSFDLLWGTFMNMMNSLTTEDQIFIIVDALDECVDASGLDILERLAEILRGGNTEEANDPSPRIMVTGRRDEQVFDVISPAQHFDVNSGDTREDIHRLISDGVIALSSKRSFTKELEDMIRLKLEQNADGMFIWVVLVLKELSLRDRRISKDSIATKLNALPTKLASMFDSILGAIPETRAQEFWTVIRWLIFCRGQLDLAQLRGLLCAELDLPDWQAFEADVSYICGSFVQIEANRIHLIHQTARDFLLNFVKSASLEQTHGIDLSPCQAEADLASVCIRIMLRDNTIQSIGYGRKFPATIKGFQKMRDFIKEETTFAYAAEHWADHLSHAQDADPSLVTLTTILLRTQSARDAIMRLNYNFRYPGQLGCPADASALHLASYFGLYFLVKGLIAAGHDVNQTSNASDAPLIWAAEMGSVPCASELLKAGADPNQFEVDGWSALHWTAANGHTALCKLLLDHGADANHEDLHALNALDVAREHSHTPTIKLLYPVTRRNKGLSTESRTQSKGSTAAVAGLWNATRVRPPWLHTHPLPHDEDGEPMAVQRMYRRSVCTRHSFSDGDGEA